MRPEFEITTSRGSDGDGRSGAIVLAAVLAVLAAVLAAIIFSPPPSLAAAKKPRVEAGIRRGLLSIVGTAKSERITLRLKPGDKSRLQVDVGANGSAEFTFKRSAFDRIAVHAGAGADALSIDQSNGVFTDREATSLFGDAGNTDLVVFNGSNASEKFDFSAAGNRLRLVGAGTVSIAGVERFDLRGLGGDDEVLVHQLAGTGLGRLNLDPGEGNDRVTVEGTPADDAIGVAPAATAPHIAVSGAAAGVPIDVVKSEALAVEGLAGNDTLNGAVGLAALTQLTLDGGSGNDTINGGDGNDTLRGGTENDAIDGNGGVDTALLGAGDDSFTWDPGDASDTVEGEAGTDTMVFNGAAAAENFDLSAQGNRLKVFRAQGNITMDTAGVERVDLNALGGSDSTVVNDLSATDVKNVVVDLAADGAADTTTINGTAGNDTIAIGPDAGAVDVTGLAAAVQIEGPEAANDVLNVNGLGGDDTISGAVGLAALIRVAIDGGDGNDTIAGGDGAETLAGGDGDDAIDGNGGADTALLGAGDDSFTWDPGDGSDVVEGGQDGADTLLFNGAGGAENFDVSAVGGRVRFFRDVGNITMDLNDIEFIDVRALGGSDNAVLNDTSATGLKTVTLDLAAAIGGGTGDGATDSVTVNGTNGADDIQVNALRNGVLVNGAPVTVQINHSEAANDKLTVDGLAGDDDVFIGDDVAALIQTLVDLGADE